MFKRVAHRGRQISRISRLAILAQVRKLDPIWDLLSLPHHVVKAVWTAMQGIRWVVDGKGVLITVETKFSIGNAVGISSNDRAEKRVPCRRIADPDVVIEGVESEHNVVGVARFVR